jgi:hypothetical protein
MPTAPNIDCRGVGNGLAVDENFRRVVVEGVRRILLEGEWKQNFL